MGERLWVADPEVQIALIHERLAHVLKREREARGMSQVALARKAKINNSTLSLIESCGRQPTLAILIRISIAMDLTPLDLLRECLEEEGEDR